MASIAATLTAARARPILPLTPIAVWLLCWVILPNAAFVLLWLVAAPPRGFVIALAGVVGLIVRRWAYGWRACAFVATISYAAMGYVSAIFNLSESLLVTWAPYLVAMHPERSVPYVAGALAFVGLLATGLVALRLDGRFEGGRAVLLAAAWLGALLVADYVISHPNNAFYNRLPTTDAPFASGVGRSGFAAQPVRDRHLLLVMVELLGLPRDPAVIAALLQPFRHQDIVDRFRVTTGMTPYYGSTINGEMRALCGRWTGREALIDAPDGHCLPARLARLGYRTVAFHGFKQDMFDRDRVYPHQGFQQLGFREQLIAAGAAPCPGIFPGACDRDIPAIIARQLKAASSPQFVYWLTLNSHLPVLPDAQLHTTMCPQDAPASVRRYAMICRQFVLWREIFVALASELAAPDMPPTDVLIVGDHMPPYFDWAQRSQFDPHDVPWIMLHARVGHDFGSSSARAAIQPPHRRTAHPQARS